MMRISQTFFVGAACIILTLTSLHSLNLDHLEQLLAEPVPGNSVFGGFDDTLGFGGMEDMLGGFFGNTNQISDTKKTPENTAEKDAKEVAAEADMTQEQLFLSDTKIKDVSDLRKKAFEFYITTAIQQLQKLSSQIEGFEFGVPFQDKLLTDTEVIMPGIIVELLERIRSQDAYIFSFFNTESSGLRKNILEIIETLVKIHKNLDAHAHKNNYDIDSVSAQKSKPKQRNRIFNLLRKKFPAVVAELEAVLHNKKATSTLTDLKKKSDDAAKKASERNKSRGRGGSGGFGSFGESSGRYGGGYDDFDGYKGFGGFGGGNSYFDEGFGSTSQWGGFGDFGKSFWNDSSNFGSSFSSGSRSSSPASSSGKSISGAGDFLAPIAQKKRKRKNDSLEELLDDSEIFKKKLTEIGVTSRNPLDAILKRNPGKTAEQIFEETILEEKEAAEYLEKANRVYSEQTDYSHRHAHIEKVLPDKSFRNTVLTVTSWIQSGTLKRKELFTIEQVDAALPMLVAAAKSMTMPLSKMQYDKKIRAMVTEELAKKTTGTPEELEQKRASALQSAHHSYLDREHSMVRTKQQINSLLREIAALDAERYKTVKELLKTVEVGELDKIMLILEKYEPVTTEEVKPTETPDQPEQSSAIESRPTHIELFDAQFLAHHTAQALTQPTSYSYIFHAEGKKVAQETLTHHLEKITDIEKRTITLCEQQVQLLNELSTFMTQAYATAQKQSSEEGSTDLNAIVTQLMASDQYAQNKNIQSRAAELVSVTPDDLSKWAAETALIWRIGTAWQINHKLQTATNAESVFAEQNKASEELRKRIFIEGETSLDEVTENATVGELYQHTTPDSPKKSAAETPDIRGILGAIDTSGITPEEQEQLSAMMSELQKDPHIMAQIMQQMSSEETPAIPSSEAFAPQPRK